MADPKQPDSENDFPDSSDNSSFSPEADSFQTSSQDNQTTSEQKKQEKESCQCKPIIVNVAGNNDDRAITEAQTANSLTRKGLFVNTLLLICTLAALGLTWLTINDSRKKDAESAEREHMLDSINRRKDSIAYTRDTTNLGLAKQSVEAQINSLKETQSQFQIANEPYLQIQHPILFNTGKDTPNHFKYLLINYGELPAIIDAHNVDMAYCDTSQIAYGITQIFKAIKGMQQKREKTSGVIGKNVADTFMYPYTVFTNELYRNAFFQKQVKLYFFGTIRYTAPANKRKKEYVFIIDLILNKNNVGKYSLTYKFIYNVNRYI